MKRLLCIVSSMDTGGAETFLMKIYREIDKSKFQIDFAVSLSGFYDDEIKKLGGRIYYVALKSEKPVKSFNDIRRIVKQENYKEVMRLSAHSLSVLDLLAAKLGGAKVLAFRATNTNVPGGRKSLFLHRLFLPLLNILTNVKISPSTEAAKFVFGERNVTKNRVFILKNALDIEQFRFDEKICIRKRKELSLENKFIVGHVGRFDFQKNHSFLIDVFSEIRKDKKDAVLILVGTGNLEEAVKQKVRDLGLNNSVLFLGVRKDVPDLLAAMDVLVFPSLYEGMPNVLIEAQASGLPCVVSDTITKEVQITPVVHFMSLNDTPKKWANEVDRVALESFSERAGAAQIVREAGYDIKDVVRDFEKIFQSNEKVYDR